VLLREAGVTDFDQYAVAPGNDLFRDFFVPDEIADSLPTKTLSGYH
jgi:citronellol/citronellal dehydrogenase